MPNAVVDINDTHEYKLESLPDAVVTLRRLPYGRWLKRQEMALQIKFSGGQRDDASGEMSVVNHAVTQFEFRECIVAHNLTDADDTPLDFNKSFTIDILNPKVGTEIARYIAELHEFESDLPN